MENRVALVAELQRFYDALLADNMIQPIGGLRYVTAYLSKDMIDSTAEPSLYEQLSNHAMEISTLKEADLCGSSSIDERIFVTTIHKAKGLEFDNVIIFVSIAAASVAFLSSAYAALGGALVSSAPTKQEVTASLTYIRSQAERYISP